MIFRCTIDLFNNILTYWNHSIIEKHWPEVLQVVKTGIYDADPEARSLGRILYETLQSKYPQKAEQLFNVIFSS